MKPSRARPIFPACASNMQPLNQLRKNLTAWKLPFSLDSVLQTPLASWWRLKQLKFLLRSKPHVCSAVLRPKRGGIRLNSPHSDIYMALLELGGAYLGPDALARGRRRWRQLWDAHCPGILWARHGPRPRAELYELAAHSQWKLASNGYTEGIASSISGGHVS